MTDTDRINQQMSTLLDHMGKNKANPDPVIDQFIQVIGQDLINKRLAAMRDMEDQERRESALDHWKDFGDLKNKFRATGRTTRMLEYAIKKAASGRHVIVYGAFIEFCKQLSLLAMDLAPEIGGYNITPTDLRPHALEFLVKKDGNTPGTITFRSITVADFDWDTLREPNLPRTTISLVDHWVIEGKYPEACRELYKFMPDPVREDDKESDQDKIPPEPPDSNITT